MKYDIKFLQNVVNQKLKETNNNEVLYKLKHLKVLLSDDQIFFKLNPNTSKNILRFLDVPEEEIDIFFNNLVSYDIYNKKYII